MTSEIDGACTWILSPHSDDAALSLAFAIRSGVLPEPITVITVYSTSNFPRWDGQSMESMTRVRLDEDRCFADAFGIGLLPLGLLDAPLRTGVIDVFDPLLRPTRGELSKLSRTVAESMAGLPNAVIILPSGIGSHIDHRIVAGLQPMSGCQVFRYADQPYALSNPALLSLRTAPPYWLAHASEESIATKLAAAACYPSQPAAAVFSTLLESAQAGSVVEALWPVI